MKTEWTDAQLDEIEAAMIAEGHLEIEAATVRIRLTARKLRDDCLVVFDYENDGAEWGWCRADRIPQHGITNMHALIPRPDAREIARQTVTRYTRSSLETAEAMGEIDGALDAYQYGPTDEAK